MLALFNHTQEESVRILLAESKTPASLDLEQKLTSHRFVVERVRIDAEFDTYAALPFDFIAINPASLGMDMYEAAAVLDRLYPKTPFMVLSDHEDEKEGIEAFKVNAEYYLPRKFRYSQFILQMYTALQRRYGGRSLEIVLEKLVIDLVGRKVFYAGKLVTLRPSDYRILEALAMRQSKVMSKKELFGHLYRSGTRRSEASVSNCITSIRRKLQYAGAEKEFIYTISKVGFVLRPPLEL